MSWTVKPIRLLWFLTLAFVTVFLLFKLQKDRNEKRERNTVRFLHQIGETNMKAVLKRIESVDPGLSQLVLPSVTEEKDRVSGLYVLGSQHPPKEPPTGTADLVVDIFRYDSEDGAKYGLESTLKTIQVWPDKSEIFKGDKLYRWTQWGADKVAYRIGIYVVTVMALKPPAHPLVMKTLELLIQELGPPLTK